MLDFASVLRSPPFKVLLGPDRICLTVPQCLAKGLSDPLYVLMNNSTMKESQDGLAILDDVEPDTFVGFCEFAYTGDYPSRMKEQQPGIRGNDTVAANEEELRDETAVPWDRWATQTVLTNAGDVFHGFAEPVAALKVLSNRKPANPKRKEDFISRPMTGLNRKADQLWSEFQNLTYGDLPSCLTAQRLPNNDHTSSLNSAPSLLYHAKLYVFAEKYLIGSLRTHCLRKLHHELHDFPLTVQTSDDILEVLEFIYTHTERKGSNDDQLRTLIVHYAACKAEILKQNTGLRRLLDEYGEMAVDLFYKSC